MNVLYDHQAFTIQNYGGVSRYFFELIKSFKTSPFVETKFSLLFSNNEYLEEEKFKKTYPFFAKESFRGKSYIQNLLNEFISNRYLKKSNYDIFHPTYYDPYFLKPLGNKPFVITVYDTIHEKFSKTYPELAADKLIFKRKSLLLKRANGIIAISEQTKKDVMEIYGISSKKIQVIYLGNSLQIDNSSLPKYNFPYILFVGNRLLYKNFTPFINAVQTILKKNDIKLICAGGGDFTKVEIELISEIGLKNQVIYAPINNNNLANLYRNAIAFVFPSLYEGFGIPVIEAFSCGCPCILSERGSLPEIGGDAAIYFDPENADSMILAMENIINDKSLRKSLTNLGYQKSKLFTWENTAKNTFEYYKTII